MGTINVMTRGFLTKRSGKMRKEHKTREQMGKETFRYWKSANDIIVVNYSVHSNNQNEYMQAYRHSRPSACVILPRQHNAFNCYKPGPGAA